MPSLSRFDGIVPTNSQIWGEVVHATTADHLDVVGHFGALEASEQAGDWLPSQSRFDESQFERLWTDVAAFIVAEGRFGSPVPPAPVGTERTERDLEGAAPKG
jgi:triacylglycerol lipase